MQPNPADATFVPDRRQAAAGRQEGFTLFELTVVVTLIGIMLVLAVPRLGGTPGGDDDAAVRWLITAVGRLKEKALVDQQTYLLNISPDIQRCWVSRPGMEEAEQESARDQGYQLPPGTVIDHVAFGEERIGRGSVAIAFFPQGYSDQAAIRLRTRDGERLALFIEPFLSRVELVRGREGWPP